MNSHLYPTGTIGFLTKEETLMLSDSLAKNKPIKWKLLYNPSKGTNTLQSCFDCCNNIPSIVVLVETDKGFKFGGYSSIGWSTPPSDSSSKIMILIHHS